MSKTSDERLVLETLQRELLDTLKILRYRLDELDRRSRNRKPAKNLQARGTA